MGIEIQAWAWRQPLAPATKLVFVKLAESANDETGECWPSLRHLADRCNMAVRTVRFHIAKLRDSGLLHVEARHRDDGTQASNGYKILSPRWQESGNIQTPTLQDVAMYPEATGRGTRSVVAALEPELEPKKNLLTEDSIYIGFGEFKYAKLTAEQYAKLQLRLNGRLNHYIESFDHWVNEAPNAKHKGVRRKDRHAYESIISWSERDLKEGKLSGDGKRQESGMDAYIRRRDEKTRSGIQS